jgi:hypothetical protein
MGGRPSPQTAEITDQSPAASVLASGALASGVLASGCGAAESVLGGAASFWGGLVLVAVAVGVGVVTGWQFSSELSVAGAGQQ